MSLLDLTGKSILVVDDVKYSRATVTTLLGKMGNPVVHHAIDGYEAMEYLESDVVIDLIISDFNMPRMHGLQLLQAVRTGEQNIRRDMPFAMLTGYSEKFLVHNAMALDVNAFLIKPVSKQALEKRLHQMFKQIDSDNKIKPADSYKQIDVDDTLHIETDDKPISSPASTKRGYALNSEMQLAGSKNIKSKQQFTKDEIRAGIDQKNQQDKFKQSDLKALHTNSISTPPDIDGAYECPIQNVPDYAVLAQDVFTSDGRKYMHAGEILTPQTISLLRDLHDLEHPVSTIWIIK
ncbi:MAG: response regulator [Rhodospirillales bacterium]|jgi:YesN/AraC family two-component response regulator|nr:response regulator [Rhodospirillales bacterium]